MTKLKSFGFGTPKVTDTNTQKFILPVSYYATLESNNDWTTFSQNEGGTSNVIDNDIGTSLGNIRPVKSLPITFSSAVTLNSFNATIGLDSTEVTQFNLKIVKGNITGTGYSCAQIGSDHTVATSSTSTAYGLSASGIDENFATTEGLWVVVFATGTLTADRHAPISISFEFTYQ
tara:strand:- start:2156 stop:2680 length:525 start_codon:yes stop_codon:yes gene_type:complete